MKKYLRLLAFIVASAIPGLAMAATDYGISICGTKVTSDNASSITGSWLRSGSIRYVYSTNTLTFSNVDIYASASITVSNTCKDALHMRFSGINTISTNGVAFNIQKANGYSNVDVYFEGEGEGILNINWHTGAGVETLNGGEIYCNSTNGNYPWVCIGNGVSGGETTHSALTINAESIRGAGGGNFYISDGIVNLTGMGGTSYSTIRGFTNVYINNTGMGIWTEGVSYNSSNMRLQKNGSIYTGAVYAGWQKYGLRVCGIEVTYKNKDDISDHTNPAINNLAICQHGTTNSNGTGSLAYNPTTNTLTFGAKNGGVDLRQDRGKIDAPAIENNTGKTLIITTKSASDITTSGTSRHAIVSDQSITFNGGSTTQLGIKTTNGNAIRLTADDLTLKFDLCKVNLQSWPYAVITTDDDGAKQRWTWTLYDCNVTTTGSVHAVKAYNMSGCGVETAKTFIDTNRGTGQLRTFGTGEFFGEFKVTRATTSYGFSIAGIQVNNVNASNLYNEYVTNGTAVYDASANTLTLTDFQVDYQNKKQATSINIGASAPQGLAIVANGNNYFKNAQSGAMACAITNASGASTSSPSRWLRGTGTLDFGETGSIGLYDGVWFTIGGNNLTGAAANVTLKGGSIAGQSTSQAVLQVSEGNLELAGNSYGTARYLRAFFGPSYTDHEMLPSTVSYDSTDGRVEDASGSVYTGALSVGWKKYGLSVCNVPVTAGNKDCLADLINQGASAINPIVQGTTYGTKAASNAISYNPSSNILYLKNVVFWDNYNSNRGEAVIDNQTGQRFNIYSYDATIGRSDGQPCGIRSNSDLCFYGSNLKIEGTTGSNGDALIVMDKDSLQIRFEAGTNTTLKGYKTYAPTIKCSTGKNTIFLRTTQCNLKNTGAILNVLDYYPQLTGIKTSGVYWKSATNRFTLGATNGIYTDEIEFARATTDYGIHIGRTELNDISKDNFYCEVLKGGTVSYDESSQTVILNNVTIDGSALASTTGQGFYIDNYAPDITRVKLIGTNTIKGLSVPLTIRRNKNNGDNYSQVTRRFVGSGTLDVDGPIRLEDQPWVSIGDDDRDPGGGPTVKAKYLYGYNGKTARLWVADGSLELSGGNNTGTLYDINAYFIQSDMVTTPSDVSFNISNNRIEQNGALYTGPLRLGWEDYGLSILGIRVTGANKDDIRDYVNDVPTICVYGDNGAEQPPVGSLSYDPSTKTLTLKNKVYINDLMNTANPSAFNIDNTIDGLTIRTLPSSTLTNDHNSHAEILSSRGHAVIRTTKNINFSGTGKLYAFANTGHVMLMDGNNIVAKFNSGSNTTLYGWAEDPNERSVIGVVEEADLYGISVDNATLTTNGWMKHIGYFSLNRAEFAPIFGGSAGNTFLGSMLCDETGDHMFHMQQQSNGARAYMHGKVQIVPATSYGIKVGGYDVNDQNYRYVVGGSLYNNGGNGVKYDPEENVLTLSYVNAYDKYNMLLDGEFVERYSNGINITASAPKDLKIKLEDSNNFYDINGVGMTVNNSPTFIGDGSLSLLKSSDGDRTEQYATIYLYDGSDLSLNDEVKLYASQLVGSDGNGGGLYIMGDDFQGRATLDLSGDGSTATIRGIGGIHDAYGSGFGGYGKEYSMVLIPNGGYFNYSAKTLNKRALDDGSTEKDRVLIGPAEDYGILVNAMRVNSYNAEDILAGTEFEYSGKLSFNDSWNELTMDNLTLQSGLNLTSLQVERPNYFDINLIGDNEWINPNQMIFRAGDAYFLGTGSLTYPNEIQLFRRQRDLIDESGEKVSEGTISFKNCTVTATNIRSSVDNMDLVNGRLEFSEANVTLTGSDTAPYSRAEATIQGFAEAPDFGWSGLTRIATPSDWSWYDNNGQDGNHRSYFTSGGVVYSGLVKVVTSYGIYVAGIEVTGENKDDVLSDGGSVTFAPAADDDDFGYVSRLVLKRATINGNITMSEAMQDDDCILELIGDNTINAGRQTGISTERMLGVSSRDAYGKLYVNTSGTGIELKNSSDLMLTNAELNINAGTYGIKGQYTDENLKSKDPTDGDARGGYESVAIFGTRETYDATGAPGESTPYYSKLVVKNSNSSYPLIGGLYNFNMDGDVAVQEPVRAHFDTTSHTFVGSNGTALANTTLIISNDDYNTVGIGEVNSETLNGDVYDLSGRKMNNTRIQRGVYIVGGKKVAVK